MGKKRKFVSLVFALTFSISIAIGTTLVAQAEENGQMETELNAIVRRLQEQFGKVKQIRQEVNTVTEQLDEVEKELDQRRSELRSVENRLLATQRQIEENTKLLEKTEKSLAGRSQMLNKRIRHIYMNGQLSYLDVLFGASDFTDFVTRYDLFRRILQLDAELIAKAKAEREFIAQKKKELERDIAAMQGLRQVAVEKKELVTSRYQAKLSILDSLESQKDETERAYNDLQRASKRIEQMIRARKGSSVPSGDIVSGTYIWPTDGVVTSSFGWRTHPIFGKQILHAGMDIGADYGENVVAADGGVVVTAGEISGYGETVIIEHNATYSTLYAHSSELLVSEGQVVKKGQLIARVGETGYTTGPNLHFEVRVNGSPTDPREYLTQT